MKAFSKKSILLILLLSTLMPGCKDLLMPQNPPDTPIENFDALWKEFDAHYSFFIYKNINWDSLYTVYRPDVNNNISDCRLFNIMSELLAHLKDGHVYLNAPFRAYAYDEWYTKYYDHFNLDLIRNSYLDIDYTISPSRKMLYGQVRNDIGYIYIISFSGTDWPSELDNILKNLHTKDGLIIDIRDNFGGNDYTMLSAAGHFADCWRLFRLTQYRNGPEHDDFSPPIKGYLKPVGKVHYIGNIAVLTNRSVFSAAESFVLAMNTLPYVTTIGDTTGGGSANPINRELPNGWTYSISTWIESTPAGQIYEGKGIPPDIHVTWPDNNISSTKDYTLETAINYLINHS